MYIKDLSKYEGSSITLKGWAANKRESKGLVFLILRDGTGLCQCVVDANNVSEAVFEEARKATLETSLELTGKVVKDDRQIGGYEVQVTEVKLIQVAVDYPIVVEKPAPMGHYAHTQYHYFCHS